VLEGWSFDWFVGWSFDWFVGWSVLVDRWVLEDALEVSCVVIVDLNLTTAMRKLKKKVILPRAVYGVISYDFLSISA